ncbi:MAG: peptidoglycan DD-metalloendopeptidase family protein [Acidobacteriota bacterium]|nr:peptidoglycan DD-metalloendopeptidase family protein [Acidobacteriota bacterium]
MSHRAGCDGKERCALRSSARPPALTLMLAALSGFVLTSLAAPAVDVERRTQLTRVRQEIQRLSAERERLLGEERGVIGRLERLAAEARLLDARLEELALTAREADLRLTTIDGDVGRVTEHLVESRKEFRGTVMLLHRIGPLGRVRPLLEAQDAERIAGALRVASELTRRQREQVSGIRDELAELDALRAEQEEIRERMTRLGEETEAARAELGATIRARQELLAEVRRRREVREDAISELERAADELAEIVAGVRSGERWSSGFDVRSFEGLLPMPSEGSVTERFGRRRDPRFGTVLPHPGWDIDAPFGADVRAPFDGVVAWTGWLRGYGLVVVVDHGQGVHTVYAHLSVVIVQKDQEVAQGRSLGRVGDTGSLSGPYLYFEIRVDGKAVDPARWVDESKIM